MSQLEPYLDITKTSVKFAVRLVDIDYMSSMQFKWIAQEPEFISKDTNLEILCSLDTTLPDHQSLSLLRINQLKCSTFHTYFYFHFLIPHTPTTTNWYTSWLWEQIYGKTPLLHPDGQPFPLFSSVLTFWYSTPRKTKETDIYKSSL